MTAETTQLFAEQQRMRQRWLWGLLLALGLYNVIMLLVALGHSASGRPDRGAVFTFSLGTGIIALVSLLIYCLSMRIRVTQEILEIVYIPFWHKRIAITDVALARPITYRPLLDAGGWGIHYSLTGYGFAFNVSGNRGIELRLTNGRRYLIGSQHPEELADAIRKAKGL